MNGEWGVGSGETKYYRKGRGFNLAWKIGIFSLHIGRGLKPSFLSLVFSSVPHSLLPTPAPKGVVDLGMAILDFEPFL